MLYDDGPRSTVLVMCPSLSHYSLGGVLGEWEHWKRGASGREEHWGGRSIGEGGALGRESIGYYYGVSIFAISASEA